MTVRESIPSAARTRTEREISDSVERTLLEHARRNELRVAFVRALSLSLATLVNLTAFLRPSELGVASYPLVSTLIAGSFAVAAAAIIAVLARGGYRPWLRFAMPVFDACIILWLFETGVRSLEPAYLQVSGVLVNMAAVCALLAVSGGLRLKRASAALTTALALGLFAFAAQRASFGFVRTAFVSSLLVGTGALGMWMNDVVRGAIQAEVARAILARFLPASVIAEAHERPLSLIGKPRSIDATVMVSDLRGFTAISESLPPEQVLAFLNEIQGRLAEVVQEHGGAVDKFMGDGLLAVFGAAEPRPDHARCALRAAAAMTEAARALTAPNGRPIGLGIGLHSGEVVAGCMGSGARLEFTVIGDTVNTASRLEALTKDKGVAILASDAVVRRARDDNDELGLRCLGAVSLRGRKEQVVVHTLQA